MTFDSEDLVGLITETRWGMLCKKLELIVHLKMQRRVKIVPLLVLHALVRSNKKKYKKLIFSFSSYGLRQTILQAGISNCCWSKDLVSWQNEIKSKTWFELLLPTLRDFFSSLLVHNVVLLFSCSKIYLHSEEQIKTNVKI